MCFGCLHRRELEEGTIPSNITYEEYMQKYFLVKEEFRPKNDAPLAVKNMEEAKRIKEKNTTWSVYMVECSDGTIYTGVSNNVSKRILTHNEGKGAKYTKTRLPVVLKWSVECLNKSEAFKLEYRIKKLSRKQKLQKIAESGN